MNSVTDYKTLSWNLLFGLGLPGQSEQAMIAIECDVARRILQDLEKHPQGQALRTRIQRVPFLEFPSPARTEPLRRDVWTITEARQWIGSRNATSHNCLLWQFALVRLSERLNTGQWNDETADANDTFEYLTHQEK